MVDIRRACGIISGDMIYLYDRKPVFQGFMGGRVIDDISIHFNDNGSITISGDAWDIWRHDDIFRYKYGRDPESISEGVVRIWLSDDSLELIEDAYGVEVGYKTLFDAIRGIKSEYCKSGCRLLMRKRIPYKVIMSKWTIYHANGQ